MSEPFLGELKLVPYNFAPRGWAFCQGQVIAISQNSPLFSLIGTVYGGDGQTTFGLPNLAGRVPIGAGQGAGLSPYQIGQTGGSETVTLNINQMPAHNHPATLGISRDAASAKGPNGAFLAATEAATYVPTQGNAGNLAGPSVGLNGNSQPHPNIQPYQVLNWVIALVGIFPSRN